MHIVLRALMALACLTSASIPASAATFNFEFSQPLGGFFGVPNSILLAEPSSIIVAGQPTLVLRRISQGRQSVDPNTSFDDAKIIVGGQDFSLVYQPFTLPGTAIGEIPRYGANPLSDIEFSGYDKNAGVSFSYPISFLDLAGLADFGAGGPNLSFDGIGPFVGQADTLYFALGGSFTSRPDIYSLSAASAPEPVAWTLMIVGFGLVGSAMRRQISARVTYDRSIKRN